MENEIKRIATLKKEKNAVILAHFYQPPEIQKIADFVGDSLELSKLAKQTQADTIVCCGVYFMAESAKLLSPEKTVLIPRKEAGCQMADMIEPDDVKRLRAAHPGAAVVVYVNSSAAVKAESDICCTSSNAVEVVNSLPNDEIIFIPDQNLGSFVARSTDKTMYFFDGYCPIHHFTKARDVEQAKAAHPGAPVLVHPECPPAVVDQADFVASTAKIITYVNQSEQKEFIIGTEQGILYPLQKNNPDKVFHLLTKDMLCPNMKKISLADVVDCLEYGEHRVELDQETMRKASESLSKMLAVK